LAPKEESHHDNGEDAQEKGQEDEPSLLFQRDTLTHLRVEILFRRMRVTLLLCTLVVAFADALCERPTPPTGVAIGVSGFPRWPPPPGPSREALRIHHAAHYGIVAAQGPLYDGKTLEVHWTLDYNCTLLEHALEELQVCAHEFNATLECGPTINAAKLKTHEKWFSTACGGPDQMDCSAFRHFARFGLGHPYWADVQCHENDATCFTNGHCHGCRKETIVRIMFVQ
jgi:hypothetical protein